MHVNNFGDSSPFEMPPIIGLERGEEEEEEGGDLREANATPAVPQVQKEQQQ